MGKVTADLAEINVCKIHGNDAAINFVKTIGLSLVDLCNIKINQRPLSSN